MISLLVAVSLGAVALTAAFLPVPGIVGQISLPGHLTIGTVVAIALLLVNLGLLLAIVTYGLLTGVPAKNRFRWE